MERETKGGKEKAPEGEKVDTTEGASVTPSQEVWRTLERIMKSGHERWVDAAGRNI